MNNGIRILPEFARDKVKHCVRVSALIDAVEAQVEDYSDYGIPIRIGAEHFSTSRVALIYSFRRRSRICLEVLSRSIGDHFLMNMWRICLPSGTDGGGIAGSKNVDKSCINSSTYSPSANLIAGGIIPVLSIIN